MNRSMGRRFLVLLASVGAAAVALSVQAQDKAPAKPDPARGQQIASQVCVACHNADGNSTIPGNPRLAQQHAAYLYKQLVDYSTPSGQGKPARENPVMNGFASQLSDADKRNVAAWFSSQPAKPGFASSKDHLELGQRIWRAGIPEKSVPACAGCHGPAGSGIPVQYPRLAGQHAEYTETTLKAFREGTRHNNTPMQQIAAKLSDAEIRALADFAQGLRR
ncbi:MAG: cytochrome c4 [Burkholderiaceae bacterium]|jgi:cytochrome c553|nr:cytochrome c4 [Burkholderiaceae bacterium]